MPKRGGRGGGKAGSAAGGGGPLHPAGGGTAARVLGYHLGLRGVAWDDSGTEKIRTGWQDKMEMMSHRRLTDVGTRESGVGTNDAMR